MCVCFFFLLRLQTQISVITSLIWNEMGQFRSRDYSGILETLNIMRKYIYIYFFLCLTVNVGDYIQAVLDRNLAENISRVLYPNDNVSVCTSGVT